jgi:hypothetical protein
VRAEDVAVGIGGIEMTQAQRSGRPVEQVDARWRIAVGDEQNLCYFDVELDGDTFPLTAQAARTLRDKLSDLLAAAERSADQETIRDGLAGKLRAAVSIRGKKAPKKKAAIPAHAAPRSKWEWGKRLVRWTD